MGYLAFAFEEEKPLREACFRQFMKSMPAVLYRIKGYVLLGDRRDLRTRASQGEQRTVALALRVAVSIASSSCADGVVT